MMKGYQRRKETASSVPEGMIWGIGSSMTVVLAGSILLAKLLNTETVSWENAGYVIMGILIVASFAGTMVSCGKIKRKRMQMSMMFACLFWTVLISITALFFGGQYDGAVVTACLILATSIATAMLGGNSGKGRKRKKIKAVRC